MMYQDIPTYNFAEKFRNFILHAEDEHSNRRRSKTLDVPKATNEESIRERTSKDVVAGEEIKESCRKKSEGAEITGNNGEGRQKSREEGIKKEEEAKPF